MQTSNNLELHIVCFDVPAPPDYGGAIDVYYKIKAFYEAGCIIYLHCFQYGRDEAPELKQWCKEVWYYKRNTGIKGLSLTLPYIVYSRRNSELLQRLIAIDVPILFEGVHSSYYLSHSSLKGRMKLLRTHNVESEYYSQLATRARGLIEKIYFNLEAKLLKRYEQKIHAASVILPLSQTDENVFADLYTANSVQFIAPFHPYNEVTSLIGKGSYILYHGNLSHPENAEVALYIAKEIIPKSGLQFIIAGRNPTHAFISTCSTLLNCKIVANPSADTMQELIKNAQAHLMLTFQPTGMKLKLLYALYSGRHVIANKAMLQGTGLDSCCALANDTEQVLQFLADIAQQNFTEEEKIKRAAILRQHYSNANNANLIVTYLQQMSL